MTREEYIQKILELTNELHFSTGFSITEIKFEYHIEQSMLSESFNRKTVCTGIYLETLK